MKKINVGIVGASGLVGRTFLKVIEEYHLPIDELRVFASSKSVGKTVIFAGKEYALRGLEKGCFKGLDFVLFSAGGDVSKQWSPVAEEEGAIVIDNSSAWRMNPDCGLIVPEINPLDYHGKRKIIANPNCSTIQSVLPVNALKPLGIKRVIYSSYQAVAGAGMKGLNDYKNCIEGGEPKFFPYNIAKTCIPQIDVFQESGFTKEEEKMINETRKILHMPDLNVTATCVRVPVEICHGVAVIVELEKDFTVEEVKNLIAKQEGCMLCDDINNNIYPTSIIAKGNDNVYVGRIRKDICNPKTILFYCVADNIRKGAAANAVQIMKKIMEERDA